ncbi:zinc ribbon domain-containing protein [candidate division CSSED10-310 bacterium]|uniref:Zinc ribbon domain-containing protein n=1 Tax=candidate division CSSED10-310 bacterium TaxID=2855610 RepID=A0ABV6YXT3_UNCC1
MPIYEYYCPDCHKIYQFFVRNVPEHRAPACPRCESTELTRRFSIFTTTTTEESRLEKLADPSKLAGLDENDPKSLARWMRKMSKEIGDEDMGPEFNEMIDRLEAGEDPEEIERSMSMDPKSPPTDSTLYEA